MKKLVLLNAPITTVHGDFRFSPLILAEARNLVREFVENQKRIESAIGHAATAEVLSELLDYKVEPNRIEFLQTTNDVALVFKLKSRVAEGKVLDHQEIEAIGYEFGLLTRLQ